MNIITGTTGKMHVTSAHHRKIIDTLIGESYLETFVADYGEKMSFEIAANNKIRIGSGMLFHRGCVGEVPNGTYDEVSYEPGETGKYRRDVLVAKYEKDTVSGTEKFDWEVVKGISSDTYPAPIKEYVTENLREDGEFDRVAVAGIDLDGMNATIKRYIQTADELRERTKKSIVMRAHPVGSIYMSVDSTNPSDIFGFGTWQLWGAGRVPVGVDTTQTEFSTPEKTGGEKTHTLTKEEMPEHQHMINYSLETVEDNNSSNVLVASFDSSMSSGTSVSSWKWTGQTGGGTAHNNLQPYITCYMWKRTS